MLTITTLAEYCATINIPPPKHPHFDIRRFEDNMLTVNPKQEPFRHEFYAIALRYAGTNKEVMGKPLVSNLFFNSPYQIVTWNIAPDWQGWYIIFDREFVNQNPAWASFIVDYPFLRLDRVTPINLPEAIANQANQYFELIYAEYHSTNSESFSIIQAYTQLLLLLTKRYFNLQDNDTHQDTRSADILLASRYQTLVETLLANPPANSDIRQPSFYAEQLNVHPNHLNAVIKRITGQTAGAVIQAQLVLQAKAMLTQTSLNVKEIAYALQFTEPTHFNAFFRKHLGLTPAQYRKQQKV